ncbi:hypothetical protein Y032_0049g1819 [Ancylostoma ceylanicum]|uniref:Uncharacterized protein n=1 Tax=Ancylostoma ceylanicum TaxID=53326 RepID=A0A016U9M2_9BILA|nr:hypothetical protein Y032_0049g1819 [Ancylostoma ceylanicum]
MRYPLDHFAAAAMFAVRTHERTTRGKKLIQKCISKRSMVHRIATHGNHGWFARSKFHKSHLGPLWQGNRMIGAQPPRAQNLQENILTGTLHTGVIGGAEHKYRIYFAPSPHFCRVTVGVLPLVTTRYRTPTVTLQKCSCGTK